MHGTYGKKSKYHRKHGFNWGIEYKNYKRRKEHGFNGGKHNPFIAKQVQELSKHSNHDWSAWGHKFEDQKTGGLAK